MKACVTHRFDPFYRSPFHVVKGAAWATEYCRCGTRQDHVVNPNSGAIQEDQPTYITHAVLRGNTLT